MKTYTISQFIEYLKNKHEQNHQDEFLLPRDTTQYPYMLGVEYTPPCEAMNPPVYCIKAFELHNHNAKKYLWMATIMEEDVQYTRLENNGNVTCINEQLYSYYPIDILFNIEFIRFNIDAIVYQRIPTDKCTYIASNTLKHDNIEPEEVYPEPIRIEYGKEARQDNKDHYSFFRYAFIEDIGVKKFERVIRYYGNITTSLRKRDEVKPHGEYHDIVRVTRNLYEFRICIKHK